MTGNKVILPDMETISMSGRAASLLIGSGCPEAALVYIYILKNSGNIAPDAAAQLRISSDRFNNAMSTLALLGLIRTGDVQQASANMPQPQPRPAPADELPEYSIADIKCELENGAQFSMLTDEVQRALGKVLSSSDLIKLFGIYDALRLPPEVILQLVMFCIEENRRRHGEGKLPTMRYIEKVAYTWEREEIFSLEKAEEYIKNLTKKREIMSQFAMALQIKGRDLSDTERRYIESWIAMGFSSDAAAEAFDRTVTNTGGRFAWKYADTIMRNWNSKNLHSISEIEKHDPRIGQKPSAGSKPIKPPTNKPSGGPTAADMERMRKALEKIKEG